MRLELVLPQLVALLAVPGAEHSTFAINPPCKQLWMSFEQYSC